MQITQKHLPDFCYSSQQITTEGILIHYFSGKYQFPDEPFDPEKCYNLFVDLNRPMEEREHFKMESLPQRTYGSAHYMIDREGLIYELVPLPYRAWHAGESEWNGRTDCNSWMIGIELIATYDSGYTDQQYYALDDLSEMLISNYGISKDNITGHEDVAPDRKNDPGPNFDWETYWQLLKR